MPATVTVTAPMWTGSREKTGRLSGRQCPRASYKCKSQVQEKSGLVSTSQSSYRADEFTQVYRWD